MRLKQLDGGSAIRRYIAPGLHVANPETHVLAVGTRSEIVKTLRET